MRRRKIRCKVGQLAFKPEKGWKPGSAADPDHYDTDPDPILFYFDEDPD